MFTTLGAWVRRWHMKTIKPFGSYSSRDLRISFADTQPRLVECLAQAFANVPAVEVVCGSLLDLRCDALVSPANSFGDMSGGIDKAIDDFHHGEAQRLAQAAIAEQFLGELPVGMAIVVKLSARRFPFLVVAPTMRVPGNVAGSIHAYLAMRGTLVAVHRYNQKCGVVIRTLAMPGLGTGVGGIHPAEAAEQMYSAYTNVVDGQWRQIVHPVQAPYALRGVRLKRSQRRPGS